MSRRLSAGSIFSGGYVQAWVGLGLVTIVGVNQLLKGNIDQVFAAFGFLAIVILAGFAFGVFDMAWRVDDAGTHLLVSRARRTIRLPLAAIGDYEVRTSDNSTTLKLYLVGENALGECLEFVVDPGQAEAIGLDLVARARDARVPPR